jgi:hypothetical protein
LLRRRLKTRGRVYAVSNGDLRSGDHMPRSITIRGTFHDARARARAHTAACEVYYARYYAHAASDTVRHFRWVNAKADTRSDDALGFFPQHFRANSTNDASADARRVARFDDVDVAIIIGPLSEFLRPYLCRSSRSDRTISVWKKWPVQKKVVNGKEVMEAVRYQI